MSHEVSEVGRDHADVWGPRAAAAAGLLWIIDTIAGRLSPDPDEWDCNSRWDYFTNALDPLAFFLLAAAVVALWRFQRDRAGLLGTIGAVASTVGALAAGINNPLEHCAHIESLGAFLWVPSVLLLTAGLLVLGAATIRARVLPWWAGIAILAGLGVVTYAAEAGGGIALGLSWIAVGIAMWRAAPRHRVGPMQTAPKR